jgi:hypothetical protein
MRYWWVNQNQTYRNEVPGGYMWPPKTRSDDHRYYSFDTMTMAKPGDIVQARRSSFISTEIRSPTRAV